MAHDHTLAQTLEYTRTLIQAGMIGLSVGVGANHRGAELTAATRDALKAAAIAAGLGLLSSGVARNPKRAVRNAVAFGGLTFCADFCWRSRIAGQSVLSAVRREVSNARDQHWLELNPVDYA